MSSSQHPVALALERRVGGATRLLATVMLLPLLDGVFVAVVLAGGLTTVTGIVEVGLLVFGGSATLAVILAEMEGSPKEMAVSILTVGAVVIAGAVLVAALAPTVRGLLRLEVFERFAAVIILAIAGRTASARIGEWLPRPSIILLLGFVASVTPSGVTLTVQTDPALMLRAAASAGVGVAFALAAALGAPWLRNAVDIDRFRFGSAVALGVLPLSIFGFLGNAPVALAVLGVTTLLSFDPQRARERDAEWDPDRVDVTAAFADGGASQGVSHDDPDSEPHPTVDLDEDDEDGDEDRLPWL
ncbi:DUF5794 domain-containing protein [Halomicrobium salinisoli]|uniref:DUF5794 domain-containing protein n=1 Tax=Halomicrobium salinisoli TaxID=2878391 RepID=UPI001CEFD97E|nr:DUF5794 domain-containing protein [Halomicrobium salinisoli]